MKATKALSTTFTYKLGKSLYVPLTSRCNSLTLPQTRGPNFLLPNSVVASLLKVRSVEQNEYYKYERDDEGFLSSNDEDDWVEKGEGKSRSRLPSPIFPKVDVMSDIDVSTGENIANENGDGRHPTAMALLGEIEKYIHIDNQIGNEYEHDHEHAIDSIVFAGEGEPTLRLGTILHIARKIRTWTKDEREQKDDFSTRSKEMKLPMRIVTNGIPLITTNVQQNQGERNQRRHMDILNDIKEAGIQGLSVALMTSCPQQYMELMQPEMEIETRWINANTNTNTNKHFHDGLCEMVKDAVHIGLDVELTGVDHDFVDKERANDLAVELGVEKPFRWRPFFP